MVPRIITGITVTVERHAVTAQQADDAGGDRTHEPRDFVRRRNSGLHISTNGRALAALLEDLVRG